MNARSELDGVVTMIEFGIDGEQDRQTERFLKETQDELRSMANRVNSLFAQASEL